MTVFVQYSQERHGGGGQNVSALRNLENKTQKGDSIRTQLTTGNSCLDRLLFYVL